MDFHFNWLRGRQVGSQEWVQGFNKRLLLEVGQAGGDLAEAEGMEDVEDWINI